MKIEIDETRSGKIKTHENWNRRDENWKIISRRDEKWKLRNRRDEKWKKEVEKCMHGKVLEFEKLDHITRCPVQVVSVRARERALYSILANVALANVCRQMHERSRWLRIYSSIPVLSNEGYTIIRSLPCGTVCSSVSVIHSGLVRLIPRGWCRWSSSCPRNRCPGHPVRARDRALCCSTA